MTIVELIPVSYIVGGMIMLAIRMSPLSNLID